MAAGEIQPASPIETKGHSGGQFSLENATRSWTMLWLILKAAGWRASKAICRSMPPVRVTFGHGKQSYFANLISNPRFYEMVMGWPIGWTAPEQPVTEFQAWLQRSRGQFSKLLSAFPHWIDETPLRGEEEAL